MPSDRGDGAIEFLVASPSQLDDVLTILDEAARWLQGCGVAQWPSRFEPSWVAGTGSAPTTRSCDWGETP